MPEKCAILILTTQKEGVTLVSKCASEFDNLESQLGSKTLDTKGRTSGRQDMADKIQECPEALNTLKYFKDLPSGL